MDHLLLARYKGVDRIQMPYNTCRSPFAWHPVLLYGSPESSVHVEPGLEVEDGWLRDSLGW